MDGLLQLRMAHCDDADALVWDGFLGWHGIGGWITGGWSPVGLWLRLRLWLGLWLRARTGVGAGAGTCWAGNPGFRQVEPRHKAFASMNERMDERVRECVNA